MRIIAGRFKGRSIRPPAGLPVRPTTDRAKEALFNILESRFEMQGLRVLDLFAGTGNITLEFLSREAGHVTAVDIHAKCTSFISKTANQLGTDNLTVCRAEVSRFIESAEGPFDLIFLDPPYDLPAKARLISRILERKLLSPIGQLILEHDGAESFENLAGFTERRNYGKSAFTFFAPADN